MGIEYVAVIAEEDYHAFKIIVSTPLPREYDMWLRVRLIFDSCEGWLVTGAKVAAAVRL